jgi:hypothetical protein
MIIKTYGQRSLISKMITKMTRKGYIDLCSPFNTKELKQQLRGY